MQNAKLSLYYFDGCPYCTFVQRAIAKLDVEVELLDTLKNPQYRAELVEAMGRGTVPVLKQTHPDGQTVWLPESRDIVQFLQRNYQAVA